jgi:hypothetical protein
MIVHGTSLLVKMQLVVVINQFCSGAVPMDVHGTRILVRLQLMVVISLFYSGAV